MTVKVKDTGDLEASATFTIDVTPVNDEPTLELNGPKGGEFWSGLKYITWTASDSADPTDTLTIDIEYKYGSNNWETLASNENNDGTFNWHTNDGNYPDAADYLIKVIVSDGIDNIGGLTSDNEADGGLSSVEAEQETATSTPNQSSQSSDDTGQAPEEEVTVEEEIAPEETTADSNSIETEPTANGDVIDEQT